MNEDFLEQNQPPERLSLAFEDCSNPNVGYLGMMLPYTPLHHILLKETELPLVMTSGNLSEEPIARENEEAVRRLSGIADFFLVNNRDIYSTYLLRYF